jgi:hypothetical protein
MPGSQSGSFGAAFNSWGRRDVRVSDADREQVVDALRRHAGDGRLTVDELTDRVGQAYAAKTYGELEVVQRGLPRAYPGRVVVPAASGPIVFRRQRRHRTVVWLVARLALLNLVLVAIWAVTGHHFSDFWPAWVMGASVLWIAFRGLRVLERRSADRHDGAR